MQFAQNGGGQFADTVTGAGALHLIGGTLQLTGTANTYSGGTFVEAGSTLDLTTANVSTGNANIADAGGLIVFDQATTGTYTGVISDGRQMRAPPARCCRAAWSRTTAPAPAAAMSRWPPRRPIPAAPTSRPAR